jgi:hypothetical protein
MPIMGMTDFEYTKKEIHDGETEVLKFLDWNITFRTCREFVTMALPFITTSEVFIHVAMV